MKTDKEILDWLQEKGLSGFPHRMNGPDIVYEVIGQGTNWKALSTTRDKEGNAIRTGNNYIDRENFTPTIFASLREAASFEMEQEESEIEVRKRS